jgi:predicted DNA-binding transcriptional regulator AlpA
MPTVLDRDGYGDTHMSEREVLLDEVAYCDMTNTKKSTARKQRVTGCGPRFVKIGRSVRYRRGDVLDWLESRTVRSTSENLS